MSEWRKAILGEVLTHHRRPVSVEDGGVYPAVSVMKDGSGLGEKDAFVGGVSNYKTLYRVHNKDVVLRTITAFESPVGVAGPEHDGAHVSQVFLTYAVSPDVLPSFLMYFFQTPIFWSEMRNRARGTVLRRKTISDAAFRDIPVAFPPLDEQRRIVAVVSAVDDQIEALEHEAETLGSAVAAATSAAFSDLPQLARLGDVASTRSGPSFAATDVAPLPSPDAVPIIGIPNTKPDGTLDLSDVGYVSGLPTSVRTIDQSSLVLIRTNGNRQRIGNVYLPPPEALGYAVSAFQFLMKTNVAADREFVFWALRDPKMQARMSDAASGTTGLGNLAVKWLNAVEIQWSDDAAVRDQVVKILRAQQTAADGVRDELAETRALRSSLVSALLSQSIEIPESYDEVFDNLDASGQPHGIDGTRGADSTDLEGRHA